MSAPSAGARASAGHGFALLLAVSSLVVACLDLTVPPNAGEDAAAGDNDAADVPTSSGGGAGAGGRGGNGGQSGGASGSDAGSTRDGDDAGPTSTGGRGQAGGGGRTDALAANGGNGDTTASGTGGVGTGGTAGATTLAEDAAGKDSVPDSAGPDSPAEVPADAALTDAADAPGPNLSAGLVAYYSCEQLEGSSLRDQSGSGNHATVEMGGGASGLGYRIEPGKLGNGLTLVQTGSGYVNMPPAAFVGSADITIASWIKLTTVTNWQRLFDVGINANLQQNAPTGTVYMTFFIKNPNNKLGLGSSKDGFSNAQQITAETLPTGTWKHIAVVIASGTASLYVDGTAVASISPFLAPHDLGAVDYAFLGRSQFQVDPYIDAAFDEIRVYNRALAVNEVQALIQYSGP